MKIDFKKLRDVEGITPEDIAETLNISQAYVSLLLNGKRKMSRERWKILTDNFCNITKYVIDESDEIEEVTNSNITEENGETEETIPAYVLKMHNEERKRFDAQMSKMLEQNDEMLAQNRILVEALRDQMKLIVHDNITPTYMVAEPEQYNNE